MAKKPVFGCITCPYCGATNPVFWNGNMRWSCVNCKRSFKVSRQKLTRVEPYKGNIVEDKETDEW